MAIGNGRRRPVFSTQHTNTELRGKRQEYKLKGRQWRVTYYNKIVQDGELVRTFDINTSTHLKNFNVIEKMKLFVINELPVIGDREDIKGSSYVKGEFVPTIGDIFIAKLSNELMLFKIDTVKRVGYNSDSVFEITYSMVRIFESQSALDLFINSLKNALVTEYVYNDVEQIKHINPIIQKSIFEDLKELAYIFPMVVEDFIKWMSKENKVPFPILDGVILEDLSIVNFNSKVIDFTSSFYGDKITIIHGNQDEKFTVLDSLLNDFHLQPRDIFTNFEGNRVEYTTFKTRYKFGTLDKIGVGKQNANLPAFERVNKLPNPLGNTYLFSVEFYRTLLGKEIEMSNSNLVIKDDGVWLGETMIYRNLLGLIRGQRLVSKQDQETKDSMQTDETMIVTNVLEKEILKYLTGNGVIEVKVIKELMLGFYEYSPLERIYFMGVIIFLANQILGNEVDSYV